MNYRKENKYNSMALAHKILLTCSNLVWSVAWNLVCSIHHDQLEKITTISCILWSVVCSEITKGFQKWDTAWVRNSQGGERGSHQEQDEED